MSDKKTQIINAAIKLLARDGVGVPTAKIAKHAKVSNGTLFNYFETKQTLIGEVYLYIKEKAAKDLMGDMTPQMDIKPMFKAIWEAYIRWSLKHKKEHDVLELLKSSQLLPDETLKAGEHFFAVVFDALEAAIHSKIIIDAPMPLITEMASAQMNAVIQYIYHNKAKDEDVDAIIHLSFNIYWKGVNQ